MTVYNLCSFALFVLYSHAIAQSVPSEQALATGQPRPLYQISIGDAVTLPLSLRGGGVSAIVQCGEDGTAYVQKISFPSGASKNGDVALYAIRGPLDLVRLDPNQAPGYKLISPITRYFVGRSGTVALAIGVPIDKSGNKSSTNIGETVNVLLNFNLKGEFVSAVTLEPDISNNQIAAFDSGNLLLLGLDDSRMRTRLMVTVTCPLEPPPIETGVLS